MVISEGMVTAREAAEILNRNSGRTDIKPDYVRQLVAYGKLEAHKLDGRTNLYKRSDVEAITVERRGGKRVQSRKRKLSSDPV